MYYSSNALPRLTLKQKRNAVEKSFEVVVAVVVVVVAVAIVVVVAIVAMTCIFNLLLRIVVVY